MAAITMMASVFNKSLVTLQSLPGLQAHGTMSTVHTTTPHQIRGGGPENRQKPTTTNEK